MACIVKRESTRGATYYVKYRVDGRQVMKKAGKRRRDAEALRTEIDHSLHEGTYQELPEATVEEFGKKFLEAHKVRVRPTTLANYEIHLRAKIVPYFGRRKLKSLRTVDVESFLAHLGEGGMTPATQRKYLMSLKTILKKAVQWGYLGRSPAEHVPMPRVPKKEMDCLSPAELEKLIAATDERHRGLVMVAAYTGIRKGELLGLKWGDVDFAAGRILIRRTRQGEHFYEPKTAYSRRSVSVPRAVTDALKVQQARQAVELPANEHDLVFTNELGKPMDTMNVTHRVLEPALKRAGLPRIRFHDLRHSYASALISAGENIKWIQRQLGHASIGITMDTYGHLLPDAERDAAERLERALMNGVTGKGVSHDVFRRSGAAT